MIHYDQVKRNGLIAVKVHLNYLPLSQINACILSHFVTSHEENMSSGRRLTQSPLEEPFGSPFPQLVYSTF